MHYSESQNWVCHIRQWFNTSVASLLKNSARRYALFHHSTCLLWLQWRMRLPSFPGVFPVVCRYVNLYRRSRLVFTIFKIKTRCWKLVLKIFYAFTKHFIYFPYFLFYFLLKNTNCILNFLFYESYFSLLFSSIESNLFPTFTSTESIFLYLGKNFSSRVFPNLSWPFYFFFLTILTSFWVLSLINFKLPTLFQLWSALSVALPSLLLSP